MDTSHIYTPLERTGVCPGLPLAGEPSREKSSPPLPQALIKQAHTLARLQVLGVGRAIGQEGRGGGKVEGTVRASASLETCSPWVSGRCRCRLPQLLLAATCCDAGTQPTLAPA